MNLKERINTATECHDSDQIPKVENAGKVIQNEGKKAYQIMHNGLKTHIDSHYGDFNVEIIKLLKGHHEPQEERIFYEVLKHMPKGASMLELGSFWAYYSMWFKTEVPTGKAYMVEPMKEVIQHGIDNFKLNGLEGEFIEACVGKEAMDQTLFKHWDGSLHKIKQISVDMLIEEKDIQFLNILHADIQGAELDMLNGAKKSLNAGKIGFVFISTHSEYLHFECMKILKQYNYKIIAEHTLSESFAVDGLIAATIEKDFPKIVLSRRFTFEGLKTRIYYNLKSIFKL